MEILLCSISAAVGACAGAVFFVAGVKTLRKDIDHVELEAKSLYANANNSIHDIEEKLRESAIQKRSKFLKLDEEIDALKEENVLNRERWAATAERLDAQGARVLELEHRLQVSLPKLCEEQEEQRG